MIRSATGLIAVWPFTDGSELRLLANFDDTEIFGCPPPRAGRLLFTTSDDAVVAVRRAVLPPWSVLWWPTGEVAAGTFSANGAP